MTTTSNWYVPPIVPLYVTSDYLTSQLSNYLKVSTANSAYLKNGYSDTANSLTVGSFRSPTGSVVHFTSTNTVCPNTTITNLTTTTSTGTNMYISSTTGSTGSFNTLSLNTKFAATSIATVTQITNAVTDVTLNSPFGIINLFVQNISGRVWTAFTLINSYIFIDSVIMLRFINSTTFACVLQLGNVSNGRCIIMYANMSNTAISTANIPIQFMIINKS